MHVTRELVEAARRGDLPWRLVMDVAKDHFGFACKYCTGLAPEPEKGAGAPRSRPSWAPPDPAYRVSSADPVEAVRRRLRQAHREGEVVAQEKAARASLRRLRGCQPNLRIGTVRGCRTRYRGPLFCAVALQEARREMPQQPAEALWLAEAALVACQESCPADPDPEIRVQALAVRGNAERALGNLKEAEHDLEEALRLLNTSEVTDPWIAAELDSYLGSLRKDQSRLEEAGRCLGRAAALFAWVGDRERAAGVWLNLGGVHYRRHAFSPAVGAAERALALLGEDSEAWLLAYARFNLAFYLHARGDADRAEAELAANRELIESAGEGLALRAVWLQGRIAWSREELGRAERHFGEARRRSLARGIAWDAGLLALELALVHLVRGRTARVKKLAQDALKVFAEQEVDREIGAALELLAAAARREALTRELLERAIAALEQGLLARPAREAQPA